MKAWHQADRVVLMIRLAQKPELRENPASIAQGVSVILEVICIALVGTIAVDFILGDIDRRGDLLNAHQFGGAGDFDVGRQRRQGAIDARAGLRGFDGTLLYFLGHGIGPPIVCAFGRIQPRPPR